MSGEGAPVPAAVDASSLRVAVVGTRWYPEVTDNLVARAAATLAEAGVPEDAVTVLRVPGAFELPVVAQRLAATHDAVVCLGVVVRGGTPHFAYVCDAVTRDLGRVALDSGTPVGFGVLTVDDRQQALDRAGLPGSPEDKGQEAALAAVETALLLRGLPVA